MLQVYWYNRVVRSVTEDRLEALLFKQLGSDSVNQQTVFLPALTRNLILIDASLRKILEVSFDGALEKTEKLAKCDDNKIRSVAWLTVL